MEFNLNNFIWFIAGGCAGTVLTILVQSFIKINIKSNKNKVNQTGNTVIGNQAGRDNIIKNT